MPFSFLADLKRKVQPVQTSFTDHLPLLLLLLLTHPHPLIFPPDPSESHQNQFTDRYPPGSLGSDDDDLNPAEVGQAFEPELRALMETYDRAPPPDALRQAQTDLGNVKDIMVRSFIRSAPLSPLLGEWRNRVGGGGSGLG